MTAPPVSLPPVPNIGRLVIGIAVAAALAIAGAMAIALAVLGLRGDDATLMLQLLLISAIASLGVGTAIIGLVRGRRWDRLATRIATAQVVGALVAIICVLPTTIVMFLSAHDRNLVLLCLAYSLTIALIFAVAVGRTLGASVEIIRAGASRMAAGDLTVRVPVPRERGLAELAVALNTMAERLDAAFWRQRELEEARQSLIAAVSHDLRTPLASLRVMVEAIADGVADDPATIRRYVGAMERETVSLGRLIDDLFEMARLDAGQLALRLAPSQVDLLITETLELMEAQADKHHVSLRAWVDSGLPLVLIDPDRIQRVLTNLIQNAIRHTPTDGSVTVDVADLEGDVQVNVRDTGEGISEDDLAHVFDRFYRGDKARSRDAGRGGAGLGLAIARRLVEAHGGRIWVAQPPGGGSVFSFTIPKANVS